MHITHVGFTVSNLDEAIDFFTENFGFVLADRQVQDNPYTRATVGVDNAVIENAILNPSQSQGSQLQLLQYHSPDEEGKFLPVYVPGATHLALVVDDIETVYADCSARGVVFQSAPNRIDSGRNAGGAIAYAIGPDELRVELFEPAA